MTENTSRFRPLFVAGSAAALLIVIAIAYGKTLRFGPFAEDFYYLTATFHDAWSEFVAPGFDLGYRPVSVLFWACLNALFGGEARHGVFFPYRLVAIGVEACNAGMLALVARRFGYSRSVAAAAALLFLSNPNHADVVNWVSVTGNTGLCLLLSLAALYAFLVSESGQRRLAYVISVVLTTAALLTKEYAVTLPAILTLTAYEHVRLDRAISALRRGLAATYPHWLLLGGYCIAYRLTARSTPYMTLDAYFTLSGDVFRKLLIKCADLVWPQLGVAAGVLVAAVLILIALAFRPARVPVAWCVLMLLPASHFLMPHHLYMATAGWALLVPVVLVALVSRQNRAVRAAGILALVAVLAAGFVSVRRRNDDWRAANDAIAAARVAVRSMCAAIPAQARLFFTNLPDDVRGAWALRNGTNEFLQQTCSRTDLRAVNVLPSNHHAGEYPLAPSFRRYAAMVLPPKRAGLVSFDDSANTPVSAEFTSGLHVRDFRIVQQTETKHLIAYEAVARRKIDKDATLWIHVVDQATSSVRNLDQIFFRPTSRWREGEGVLHVAAVEIPPGRYDISIGLYEAVPPHTTIRTAAGEAGLWLRNVIIPTDANRQSTDRVAAGLLELLRAKRRDFCGARPLLLSALPADLEVRTAKWKGVSEAIAEVCGDSLDVVHVGTGALDRVVKSAAAVRAGVILKHSDRGFALLPEVRQPEEAVFSNGISLVRWNATPTGEGELMLRFVFQPLRVLEPKPVLLFVHAIPQDGGVPLNFDHGLTLPLSEWRVGETVDHVVSIRPGPGRFQLRAGMYLAVPPHSMFPTTSGLNFVSSNTLTVR